MGERPTRKGAPVKLGGQDCQNVRATEQGLKGGRECYRRGDPPVCSATWGGV